LRSPGVFIQDVATEPPPVAASGVPGFVGFAQPRPGPAPPPLLALQNMAEFRLHFEPGAAGFLEGAVEGFFANGGTRCHVAWADGGARSEAALAEALDRLGAVAEIDLVAMPDALSLPAAGAEFDRDAALRLQRRLIVACTEAGSRFAVLDSFPGSAVDTVLAQREQVVRGLPEPIGAALYWPWLRTTANRLQPPCGHVAGVYARRDAQAGVHRSPANEELFGVLDLEVAVDAGHQDRLNPEGVNCLRALPGRGIRVWGSRTLSRDPAWRHVSVRRTFLALQRWVELALGATAFEANGPALWLRVQRELETHLTELWQAGALKGAVAEQAFFVKCDAETNPTERRESGEVITEIGLATTVPAEFVLLRLVRKPGSRDAEGSD
jgi:uncharacterized protein